MDQAFRLTQGMLMYRKVRLFTLTEGINHGISRGQAPCRQLVIRFRAVDSLTIYGPTVAASVSEDSNLTITWNAGNSAETTMLMIIPSGGSQTASASGQGYYDEISGSLGSYVISSSNLSQIPKGKATISLSRGVYKIGTASNGQNYIIVSWANTTRDINLQ